MDGELIDTISYKKGYGMRQETSKIDGLHASYGTQQTVLSCWKTKQLNPNWVDFKMQTSQEIWQTLSLRQAVCCVFSEAILVFRYHVFSRKQTAVFHGSTDGENTSLNAGLRLDGLPALQHFT